MKAHQLELIEALLRLSSFLFKQIEFAKSIQDNTKGYIHHTKDHNNYTFDFIILNNVDIITSTDEVKCLGLLGTKRDEDVKPRSYNLIIDLQSISFIIEKYYARNMAKAIRIKTDLPNDLPKLQYTPVLENESYFISGTNDRYIGGKIYSLMQHHRYRTIGYLPIHTFETPESYLVEEMLSSGLANKEQRNIEQFINALKEFNI